MTLHENHVNNVLAYIKLNTKKLTYSSNLNFADASIFYILWPFLNLPENYQVETNQQMELQEF